MDIDQRKTQFEKLLKRFVVCVDVEATCSTDLSVPREQMEVIEVGAVVLDREKNWEAVRSLEFFIKPILHPVLTPFCTELTTITQEELDGKGVPYVEGLRYCKDLTSYLDDYGWSWCSWGAFDKNIFVQDATLHGLSPFFGPENHFNLKVWFSNLEGTRKGFGLGKAIARKGLKFQGQPHRALSDAQNVAQILRTMV